MGTDSTTSKRKGKRKKPKKPYPDFPLTPHPNGQWCKKVNRKVYFFGKWEDPDAALATWKQDQDEIRAGEDRPSRYGDGTSIGEVTDEYFEAQTLKFEQGELAQQTLNDNARVCKRLVEFFGLEYPVDSIKPAKWSRFRASLAKTLSPTSLGIEITRVKAVFNHAFKNEMIDRPPRYGTGFNPPKERAVREQKNKRDNQMFERDEITTLLEGAEVSLKAFILVGINAGFGNRDCALLTKKAVDLKNGIIEFPRPKTAVRRRVTLWPETIEALKAAEAKRPESADPKIDHLFFVTSRGECWVRNSAKGKGLVRGKEQERKQSWIDSLGTAFRKWTDHKKLTVPGQSFYGLRRSFLTIADEVLDPVAVSSIMGHAPKKGDMASIYRQRISDDRLRAVTDHVRAWLFGVEGD